MNTEQIQQLLTAYEPIELEKMTKIKLMNRIDTKYVLPMAKLMELLRRASSQYYAQSIGGKMLANYRTSYLDTANLHLFQIHACGHAVRQKVRVRTYVDSSLTFLEVKNKNNRGRTDKKRITIPSLEELTPAAADEFLAKHSWYQLADLHVSLSNRFQRITLVNKGFTERLTIDLGVEFTNHSSRLGRSLESTVIVEVKRDGRVPSPATEILRDLRVVPSGFSKYCMGMAMTDPSLRSGRLKPKLRMVDKIEGLAPWSAPTIDNKTND